MEIRESSEYVITRAKLLAEYFSNKHWIVTAGKNNCILIYIMSGEPYDYTIYELVEIIAECDFHLPGKSLKMTECTYMFYYQGELINRFEVLPGQEFDVWDC